MVAVKTIGLGLIALSILLFAVGYAYVRSAENALLEGHSTGPKGECVHAEGLQCPYQELNSLMIPKIIGLILDLIILGVGIGLYIQRKPEEKTAERAKKTAKDLTGDEATVFTVLTGAEGLVYQNEIVEKTGLSKVKVTRVLDKLESKGLVERRRRGMTNVIILK